MALKGQGDPRWIVENREDGRNVNNWHWTETDYTAWAKRKFEEVLGGLQIENKDITCKITSLTMSGDVSVNTRKQKTILFYELDVTLNWEGTLNKDGFNTKGKIQMPYISEENDYDDFEVKLTVEGDTSDHNNLKDALRTACIPILKQKVPEVLKELRHVAVDQTKLPKKDAPSTKLESLVDVKVPTTTPTPTPTVTTVSKPSGPTLTSFTITEKFLCSPMDLYQCFVDPNRVKAYSGGDAQVNASKGGKFKLFGGAVEGEYVELQIPTKIVQKWRFSSWPEGLYSTVTFDIEDKNGKSVLKLSHAGLPEDDKERTQGGWQDNFFRRIKGIFGYGGL